MNLIKDYPNDVTKTQLTKKITLNGKTSPYPVYKIPLNLLYFNDRNDRISTFINKYENENKNLPPLDLKNHEEFNKIIHEFIKESKIDAFNKTKKNIFLVDQREPGIVLSDGRIIDGNRRFCCLRELHSENPNKYGEFEAVILDGTNQNQEYEKQIKMLELMVQHGEDEKIGYNPIERLFGIYKDIEKNKLLTVEEYARSINESEKKVREELEIAKLVVEFLEFFNCSEMFYIARELKIDGPIRELWNTIRNKNGEDIEKMKQLAFVTLASRIQLDTEDVTRNIRNLGKTFKSKYKNEFLEGSENIVQQALEKLPEKGGIDYFNDLIKDDELKDDLKEHLSRFKEKVSSAEVKDKPIYLLGKSLDAIKEIDTNIFMKLTQEKKNEIKDKCKEINESISEILGKINV